ncbi:MAG: hypothetical protein WAX14_12500 [Rhodococcus sp. (in: high G+C Gram-positive bacteria)]|uniref:hypothetical protein n=1 Tax=Rhodococcus sp. TaxID=1831 RepID=UPI003BB5A911
MNVPLSGHPLAGTKHVYRGGEPTYDAKADSGGGVVVIAPGFECEIQLAFQNWNDVPGLDMLFVYCHQTGYHTHVTPADLGLPSL